MRPAWFPNSSTDNAAWEQARVELGLSASGQETASRAQQIICRAQKESESESEWYRRRALKRPEESCCEEVL